ncbi:hypothetical protein K3495_g5289 [Podosphaera aphanis]|nr:hypothetical protein K3495_g5289 [Podosphaera aphanis]
MAESSKAPDAHSSEAQIPVSTRKIRLGDPQPDTNYAAVVELLSAYQSCA